MLENTETAAADVVDAKLPDDKDAVTHPDTDSDDVTYQTDVNEAKKEWEEKKVGPPPGSARWNKMYWQGKESERLSKELTEIRKTVDEFRQHNDELMKAITETKDTIVKTSKQDSAEQIKTEITQLKQQRREAASINDMAMVYELGDKIDELKESLTAIGKTTGTVDIAQQVTSEISKVEDKKTYSKFLKDTSWYNLKSKDFDEAMAAYADVLWVKANKNWQGTYEENLYEVKSKVEAKFGIGGNGKSKTQDVGGGLSHVQGASSSLPPKDIKIELTDEERKVAVNMFDNLSPTEAVKRYSLQKAFIAKRREAR